MPRKRVSDLPQMVFKYRAYPKDIPQELWDTAREMQRVWNELVELRKNFAESAKDLEKEAKKERWLEFRPLCRELIKKSTLNWECKDEILARFETASRMAVRNKADLKPQFRLDRVAIPHRFTNRGMPIAKFWTQKRSERIRIDPVDKEVYELTYRKRRTFDLTDGIFGIGDATMKFVCHLHRPIPSGSIVKKAVWCGKFNRHRKPEERWEWSIQLVCEVPKWPEIRDRGPIAGLDLGWRVMAEGSYLRIGMIRDNLGRRIELRLPLVGLSTPKLLRMNRPEEVRTFQDYVRLDGKIGDAVEDTKNRIKEIMNPPAGFVKMRQGGLKKMLRDLPEVEPGHPARQLLTEWAEMDEKLMHRKMNFIWRIQGRRTWLYQNLAAFLTKEYRIIAWEGDLSLKHLAEDESDSHAIANAQKYRQFAGLYELRAWLRMDAKKNGCDLIAAPAAFSTITCEQCGEVVEKQNGSLMLECINGHRWDQDENAADNFLNYGLHSVGATSRPRRKTQLDVPSILQSMMRVY